MELFHIINLFLSLMGFLVILQYIRALKEKVTPWWSILVAVVLSLGIPCIFIIITITTFGRGGFFISPISALAAYALVTSFTIGHYQLRIKRKGTRTANDSVLDDTEI